MFKTDFLPYQSVIGTEIKFKKGQVIDMNKELESKIDLVCEAINKVFVHNEPGRVEQILNFAAVVANAPNEEYLEKAVDMTIASLDGAFDAAKDKLN